MLQVQELQLLRGEQLLLKELSFELGPGELLHLEGPNGVGKTTLLRAVCGLVLPEAGEIRWRGEPIGKARERYLRELLYLGHTPALKGELTPLENLRALLPFYPVRSDDLEGALAEVGLADRAGVPVRFLSAGQRQRVALARLLLQQATLWVLDEPLAPLDRKMAAWLFERIEDHLREGGMVLLTSHQPLPAFEGTALRLDLTPFAEDYQQGWGQQGHQGEYQYQYQ